MPIKERGFQYLLYHKFIGTHQHDAQKVAQKMNISPSTLYAYIEGDRYCPPDAISKFYNATKDLDFLYFVVQDTDQTLTPLPATELPDTTSIHKEHLDCSVADGHFSAELIEALKDGKVDYEDRKALRPLARNSIREWVEVLAALEEPQPNLKVAS